MEQNHNLKTKNNPQEQRFPKQNPKLRHHNNKHKPKINESDHEFYFFKLNEAKRFFVTTSSGCEEALQDEIQELFENAELPIHTWQGSSGCYFEGSWEHGFLVNCGSMCASRVLCVLAEVYVEDNDDLEQALAQVNWREVMTLHKTFAVKSDIANTFVSNSMFLSLKVKDILCDSFVKEFGERPNVDTSNPDVLFQIRLVRNKLSVSVDTTGEPLFKRGYKDLSHEAPLKETTAAALLRYSGWNLMARNIWNSTQPVFFNRADHELASIIPPQILLAPFLQDTFCGSGTIPIEAALGLLHWKPNARRTHWSAFNLFPLEHAIIKQYHAVVKKNLLAQEKQLTDLLIMVQSYAEKNNIEYDVGSHFIIHASDINPNSIEMAKQHAENAGVAKIISFEVKDAFESKAHASAGMLVINPPYGERLETHEDSKTFYKNIGNTFKKNYKKWPCWLLANDKEAVKSLGLHATRNHKVYNGNLDCSFLQYVIY